MSTIIFEGNTYTFGATVSANSGTGTTSFIFTPLSSGSTYGFIIWAFNGFGFSNIVGPITKITLSDDQREPILFFSYSYYGNIFVENNYPTFLQKNSLNFISPSQASPSTKVKISDQFETSLSGNISFLVTSGFTDPFGGTMATRCVAPPNLGTGAYIYGVIDQDRRSNSRIKLNPGSTYIFSVWNNITEGDTGNAWFVAGAFSSDPNESSYIDNYGRQILPVTGPEMGQGSWTYPSTGYTGWVRFAFQFTVGSTMSQWVQIRLPNLTYSKSSGYTFYFFGAQLEETNGTGPSVYMPNIYDSFVYSGNSYSITGATLYDTSIDTVVNWSVNNGLTYYWPQVNFRSIYTDDDVLNQYNNRDIFDDPRAVRAAEILKNLPDKKKTFRAQPFDSYEQDQRYYEDSLYGVSWYTGITSKYYNTDFSRFSSLTGFVGNIWPDKGICAGYSLWKKFVTSFASVGATMDYLFWDYEGLPFGGEYLMSDFLGFGWTGAKYLSEDPRYSQPWKGLTALKTFMDDAGLTIINMLGPYFSNKVPLTWSKFISLYIDKTREFTNRLPIKEIFPNAIVTNYGSAFQPEVSFKDSMIESGNFSPYLGWSSSSWIDYSAPVLYGWVGNPARNVSVIRNDPTYLSSSYYFDESQWRNKVTESEDFTISGSITNCSLTFGITYATDPFGNNNVLVINDGLTANSSHGFKLPITNISGNTSQYLVLSAYFKKPSTNGLTFCSLSFIPNSQRFGGVFDLHQGVLGNTYLWQADVLNGTTSGITSAGNSWYRCWIAANLPSSPLSSLDTWVWGSNSSSPNWFQFYPQYSGSNKDLYSFGAQLEVRDTPEPSVYQSRVLGPKISSLSWPWVSFLYTMTDMRTIKRTRPDVPITPWISDVTYFGDFLTNTTAERPIVGFSDAKLGFNPIQGTTFTVEGGNSAYYYEMIRHCMLMGSKAFPIFSDIFSDVRPQYNRMNGIINGYTGPLDAIQKLNAVAVDVHSKIGGFTLTTADTSRPNWLAPYFASGAPGPRGITWWWRITLNPQYNLLVNGVTLSGSSGPYGIWVNTTGPTLAHVPITIL